MIQESVEENNEAKSKDKSHKQRLKKKQKDRKQSHVNDILGKCKNMLNDEQISFEQGFQPIIIRNDNNQ